MEIRHEQNVPQIEPGAWVAPTAVLSGDVRVGPGSSAPRPEQMRTAMRRYARYLARSHQADKPAG
jgi:carbonic anhydrase/acetyltransferase-like protein (isoleucine patch superfamily)